MHGILSSKKDIIKDSELLEKVRLKRTKCTNIINNVACKAIVETSDTP